MLLVQGVYEPLAHPKPCLMHHTKTGSTNSNPDFCHFQYFSQIGAILNHPGGLRPTSFPATVAICCRRSCTTALAHLRKVTPAERKLGLAHWVLISYIICSMDQASLPLSCQFLPRYTAIFLVFWSCLLDMKLYVNLWHKLWKLDILSR